ncbi:MAG TPA: hypothetical protein DCG59_08000 [Leclercia adecarboxylata]|nr:hypothetical protein [Leclercia adecarboxylata]
MTQSALGRAINIAGKLFRDVIKIAIPHWERLHPLTTKPLFCHSRTDNEPLWCNIPDNPQLYGQKRSQKGCFLP